MIGATDGEKMPLQVGSSKGSFFVNYIGRNMQFLSVSKVMVRFRKNIFFCGHLLCVWIKNATFAGCLLCSGKDMVFFLPIFVGRVVHRNCSFFVNHAGGIDNDNLIY